MQQTTAQQLIQQVKQVQLANRKGQLRNEKENRIISKALTSN